MPQDDTSTCLDIEFDSSMTSSDLSLLNSMESLTIMEVDTLESSIERISMMEVSEQLKLASQIFSTHCSQQGIVVPEDFLKLTLQAMKQLEFAKRSNFLYTLVKGLGTPNSDGSDSLFPSKRV